MNRLITNLTGGHPFTLDDVRFNDLAYRDAFNSILKAFGSNLIVSGCEVNGNNIDVGYVYLNGELLKVDAHVRTGDYYQKVITFDPTVRTYKNGEQKQVYETTRAVCSAGAGPLAYNGRRVFGNVAGSACEGNDARLSDSRRCNNTFDDAAASRQNIDVYSKGETGTQITNAINALINGAPGALDTLIELSNALGSDPNFATTVTNSIALKANSADVFTKTEVTTALGLKANSADVFTKTEQGGILTKPMQIGFWNMDSDADFGVKTIPHGLDGTKIRRITASIIGDAGNTPKNLEGASESGLANGSISWDEVNIYLFRRTSGSFDAELYDATDINRGNMLIEYIQ